MEAEVEKKFQKTNDQIETQKEMLCVKIKIICSQRRITPTDVMAWGDEMKQLNDKQSYLAKLLVFFKMETD